MADMTFIAVRLSHSGVNFVSLFEYMTRQLQQNIISIRLIKMMK